jgi:FG-GAP-like repeat
VGNSTTAPSPTSPFNIIWLENPREHGGNARTDPWLVHTVGPGYFCSGGTSQCPNGAVATVSTGDFNGDGRMDIVVGQSEGSPAPPGGLKWYAAPIDRTQAWTEHDIDTSFQATHNIGVADINGDGTLDLVTGEQDQSAQHRIAVFYNDGAGNFTEQVISTDGTHNVALGDTTGDGDIDILSSPHGYYGGPHPLELFVNGRS